ncbi:MAG: hypothetical protein ABIH50_08385 [bacterium]
MNTAIVMTLIICGTVLLIALASFLFAMWVISKGISMQEKK